MEQKSDAERLGVLEALRLSHEGRHERHEKQLETEFEHINKRFDGVETLIKNSASGNNPRNSIRRLGIPVAGGGGFVAIIYLLIDRLIAAGG